MARDLKVVKSIVCRIFINSWHLEAPIRKLGKDPTVDTSFLPDREREAEERAERERLRKEWLKKQEDLKSMTNGTHRRTYTLIHFILR